MSRPKHTVNITAALARRGLPTATGTAFMAYAGVGGPLAPLRCLSEQDAIDAAVPAAVAVWVGDCLEIGAPEVVIVRAAAANVAAVTQPEWAVALALLTSEFGPGQVLIPGVTTAAAHGALLAHQEATGRCVLLDIAEASNSAAAVLVAGGLAASLGATNAGLFGGWVTVPGPGGVTRQVPASVAAAGLAAQGDAVTGHANNAPGGDNGIVTKGLAVSAAYTDADVDAMYDAGVNVFRMVLGKPTLMGWRSVSDDPRFKQLNWGRLTMEIGSGIGALQFPFLFEQIDGRGILYSKLEGALRGYLQDLWAKDALYGATADDAFDVDVAGVNSAVTAAAGELRSACALSLSAHTENVVTDIVTSIAGGVAA